MAGKGAKKRNKAKAKARAKALALVKLAPPVIIDPVQQEADFRYKMRHPERAAEEERLKAVRELDQAVFGGMREGTVATHASAMQTRAGSLVRLHRTGAISDQQLAWAVQISAEHERIDADVGIRTASLDTRVDMSVGDDKGFEKIWQVHRAAAYTRWRAALPGLLPDRSIGAQHLLAVIVDDLGITWAARHLRMSVRRAQKILEDALNLWPKILKEARKSIDDVDLLLIERRLAR